MLSFFFVGVSEVLRKMWTEKVFVRFKRARPKCEALLGARRVNFNTGVWQNMYFRHVFNIAVPGALYNAHHTIWCFTLRARARGPYFTALPVGPRRRVLA